MKSQSVHLSEPIYFIHVNVRHPIDWLAQSYTDLCVLTNLKTSYWRLLTSIDFRSKCISVNAYEAIDDLSKKFEKNSLKKSEKKRKLSCFS